MSRTLVTLIAALSATLALAAEGPRKVWTAAEVIAVSGGTPADISAAEAALAAQPAAQAGAAAKAKGKAKVKAKTATGKPKAKARKAAAKRLRARTGR